jgi:mRNA (2'-O-methyladenosine-N6-)-methyltransferase
VDTLPTRRPELEALLEQIRAKEKALREEYFSEHREGLSKTSFVPGLAVPICADIREFDWGNLARQQRKHGGQLFDVIMMDPPWKLSTSQPSRGVAIQYSSLCDEVILGMPIHSLSDHGYIFIWAINAKYRFTLTLLEKWGYKLVD